MKTRSQEERRQRSSSGTRRSEWGRSLIAPFAWISAKNGGAKPDCLSHSRFGRRSDIDVSRLRFLRSRLVASRNLALSNLTHFAERYADHFGFPSVFLEHYWRGLSYHLDSRMVEGMQAFFHAAAEIGEIERVPELRWLD